MLYLEDKLMRISEVKVPYDLGCEDGDETSATVDDIYNNIFTVFPNADVHNGVSKVVIILPNCSSVIKIPMRGMLKCDYEYYDEEEDIYKELDDPEEYFEEFENADISDPSNYCALESNIYKDAVSAGFGKFFAKTAPYKYSSPFGKVEMTYTQEKAIPLEDITKRDEILHSNSYDFAKTALAKNLCFKIRSSYWIALAIEYYGLNETYRFLDYLNKRHIGDLHNGNIGITLDGKPCLIDYSGWNS